MEDLDRHWIIQKYWSLKRKLKAWWWFKYSIKHLRNDPDYDARESEKRRAEVAAEMNAADLRECGFYWVRSSYDWTVGEWDGESWSVIGFRDDGNWQDDDLDEIYPVPIPGPSELIASPRKAARFSYAD